jgi:hypothetical protein
MLQDWVSHRAVYPLDERSTATGEIWSESPLLERLPTGSGHLLHRRILSEAREISIVRNVSFTFPLGTWKISHALTRHAIPNEQSLLEHEPMSSSYRCTKCTHNQAHHSCLAPCTWNHVDVDGTLTHDVIAITMNLAIKSIPSSHRTWMTPCFNSLP